MADRVTLEQIQPTVSRFLTTAAIQLVAFLERILPSLSADWWNERVINCLSLYQSRYVESKHFESLSSLDLAALLKVLDSNWYLLSSRDGFTSENRHFVKEMLTVRNRWAHARAEGYLVDDVYRDLDTIQRFIAVVGGDQSLIQQIKDTKAELVFDLGEKYSPARKADAKPQGADTVPKPKFEPGQVVYLLSNPSIRGAVVSAIPGQPESRYKVFTGGSTQSYYESQLACAEDDNAGAEYLPGEKFHAYLSALQIRYPGLSTLYSLNAARIDFIPYQFRPVLRFIRSDRPRLLVADSVGVGKTIEAGLILRELQARRDVHSILIICPRPLVTEQKWLREMRRFDERFVHLDGRSLVYCLNEMDLEGNWPEQYQKAILPYSLFDEVLLHGAEPRPGRKGRKGLLDLDPPPRFDLVIVDEAHHIRNQDTYSHQAVRFFCDHAEAVVFLTATPIQLGSNDLFVLLNTLRPDLIIDAESFSHMAEPNPYINKAAGVIRAQQEDWPVRAQEALDQAAATPWGQAILKDNPEFIRICSALGSANISLDDRIRILSDVESLHTFSGIINRTRRRDIGDFSIRKPETITVPFTPPQQQLHDELLQIQAEILSRLHEDVNVKFMMTTICRQAASCLFGLAPFLETILSRHLDELAWEEADDQSTVPLSAAVETIESKVQRILELACSLDPFDPKLEALRDLIKSKQKLPNNKIMVFSSFRHTLSYLNDHLIADGVRVGMIHGDVADEVRVQLRNRFEQPREAETGLDLILFSEVGCEGLDYQFCDCIVNYDLPWNPMRVEQRIGRIDRNGQKSESVAIVNIVTPGTIDADIYDRCLTRIGVFNNALGGSEEILGEISREIRDIAENYTLSDEDRRGKLQQLADNKIRLIREQEELEQRQLELFGIRLPEVQVGKEIEEASSYWLAPESIQRLVDQYLQLRLGATQELILGDKALKTLRLSQEARSALLADFQKLPRLNATYYRDWENWLKGGNPHLVITFESKGATDNYDAAFITPLHPLVKQAAHAIDASHQVWTSLKVSSDRVPAGTYEFAVYQWQYYGIREDLELKPVASSAVVTGSLAALLRHAKTCGSGTLDSKTAAVWEQLDARHYELWLEAREKHKRATQELAEFRRESLKTSHKARILLLEEQLNQATNDKIQRMRQSQIASAEADFARRLQEIEIAMERADISSEAVAYGILQVEAAR